MPPSKRHSLHLDLPNALTEDPPRIAALFLTIFDAKAGYTIAWKRSIPGLDITDSVEFKSLPSGLHNVKEDTVYFIHEDEFAGISSFVNGEAEESDRNALMLAVGALVPLSAGRLGKSWRHADGLRAVARDLAKDPSETDPLEHYWQEHQYREVEDTIRAPSGEESPSIQREKRRHLKSSPNSQPRTRNRAVSSASALAPPGQTLSIHHPALSITAFLDTFGPLIFPLYKAALLRQRILLVGQAPVESACNFVYNISVISALPSSLHDLLSLSPLPTRLRPLFSVGIHDIPALSTGSRTSQHTPSLSSGCQTYGWIACTTDNILSAKGNLYDTLITLPPSHSTQAQSKVWPKIQRNKAVNMKATQRDARRYTGLRKDLQRYRSASPRPPSSSHLQPSRYTDSEEGDNDTTPFLPLPSLDQATIEREAISSSSPDDEYSILQPQSWSALAYNSFMWWASAGEKRTDLEEESEYDSALLANLGSVDAHSPIRQRWSSSMGLDSGGGEESGVSFEVAVFGYFHRLTVLILRTLSDVIDAQDGSGGSVDGSEGGERRTGEEGEADETIEITSDDMMKMGLDVWSESDRGFVEELVEFYWGRKASVKGGTVECCGVRVL
ncbi:MAG: hypothetical protein Q9216_000789 [Gyalolechia sp. 2 TL-2023]